MAQRTAEVPQVLSMAEFEDDPIGKYPNRTEKRLKAAVPPSVKRLRLERFGRSFRGCLLVAVAVLGLVLLWSVCLVWVSSFLLLAFFPFLFQKKGRRPRNRPTFLQGLGILLFGTVLRTGTFSGIPLLSGTSDPCTRSLGSAGHFVGCFVMDQVVGSRRSPGATILGGEFKFLFCQPSSVCPDDWFRTS